MSEHDPLIERTEQEGAERSGIRSARAAEAANLFDLRRIIGGVFLAWAILLVILGLTDSDAEIERAAGVNINLWAGIGMGVLAILFLIWAFARPLGEELREAEGGEEWTRTGAPAPQGADDAALASDERRRRSGRDRPGGGGD